MDSIKKAILYARYSPRPGVSDSIEKQFERLRAWCVATDVRVAAEYSDEAISGKSIEGRSGLDKAIAHACRIKGILAAYDLSRITRNVGDASRILEKLREKNVELILLQERVDTTTPIGRCMFHVMASFAQLYREQIAERTALAMRKHQAAGRRMGRIDRPPYGFRVSSEDSNILELDEIEQAIIARIVQLRSEGETHRGICNVLEAEGLLRRGKSWKNSQGLVARILARAESVD
ncbi:MAG: recombinase family protein [Pirellulaceae bacterium]|nr:recombinase family protein [Pirellulaceae bacterium]